MLSGVLLHVVKAPVPVDGALHRVADAQGPIAGVGDDAVLFVNVGDGGAAQGAVVRRLAAPFGVEGRAVQGHQIAAFCRLTAQDRGGEGGFIGVGVIELFRFHGENFLSGLRDGHHPPPHRLRQEKAQGGGADVGGEAVGKGPPGPPGPIPTTKSFPITAP